MLNALTRQWGVVRTSDKPGLTQVFPFLSITPLYALTSPCNNNDGFVLQTINFFDLGPKVRLVDLPGYGFAFAKDEVKEAWEDLVSIIYL